MNLGLEKLLGLFETKEGTFIQHTDLSRSNSNFSIPNCLNELLMNQTKEYDESTLRGYLGEYCSRELISNYLLKNLGGVREIDVLALNRNGYAIGSRGKRVLKASNDNNIVLIEKQNGRVDNKFGFRVISEVDGLFCIVSREGKKRKKEFVIVESKTGSLGLNFKHVYSNILKPYSQMLQSPLHYVVLDFRDKLFNDRGRKILKSERRDDFYSPLMSLIAQEVNSKISVGFLDFPFSKQEFFSEVNRGLEIQKGNNLIKAGRIVEDTGEITLNIGGEVRKGVFIPENDPRYLSLIS
ncbi:MAG: hypothetical protein LAT82_04005 [Nanoarchaeota archaeon]|nr:hypothetical protein [Nanoarchaeota archaeon]